MTAPTRVRHRIVAVTFLMSVLLYLDRYCISFAEIYIQEDLGLTKTQMGWILGVFFLAYGLGQVPSGWLTDRFGARLMLTTYIVLWSFFTALTGLATGFILLLILRFGFGFGQAGAYPTSGALLANWIPLSARGRASSLVAFGGRLGAVIAPKLTVLLMLLFVPVSVPSRLGPDDLLNVPRLAYEMTAGPREASLEIKPPQAEVGRRILLRVSRPSRQLLAETAARYETALTGARQKAATAGAEKPAEVQIEPPASDMVAMLIDDLNTVLRDPTLYDEQVFADVTLSREGEQFIEQGPAALAPEQLERLNRLLLEEVYRAGIKKIYGAGWRPTLLVYGVGGLLVAGLFWFVFRNRPRQHPKVNSAEIELIEHGRPATHGEPKTAPPIPIIPLVTSLTMWLNCISQFTINVGWLFLVTLLPRYLAEVHSVPIDQRAFMMQIPIFAGMVGMLLGGVVTDRLVPLVGLRWGRALPMSLSKLLAMVAYLYVLLAEPSPWVAVAAFALVGFATDLGVAAIWAFTQDVGGRNVGAVLGWGNMFGNLGAAITPPLYFWIIGESQNYNGVFLLCAGAFLISSAAAAGIDATIRLIPEESTSAQGSRETADGTNHHE